MCLSRELFRGVRESTRNVQPAYLFLDIDCMGYGETWRGYLSRVQALLPSNVRVDTGRFVADISDVEVSGNRMHVEGLANASGAMGHYLTLLVN